MEFVGAGDDEVGDVAELELGVTEKRGVGGGGEGTCDLREEVVGALPQRAEEFLGEGFLLRRKLGLRHEASLATREVDFPPSGRSSCLCTKIPPTLQLPTLNPARGTI